MRASYSVISLLLAIFMAGCSVSKDRFRLSGKFKHLRSANIFIYSDDGHDTIKIESGKFEYERNLSQPAILTIQYPNFSEMKIVAEPGTETKFVTDASDLTQTKLSGTDENKLLSDFYSDVSHATPKETQKAAEAFVRQNHTTLAAEAVFRTYFAENTAADAKLTQTLLNVLLKSQPHNASLSRLAGRLLPYLKNAPGSTIAPFKAATFKGDTITDKQLRGKYLLIFFWARWNYDGFQQVRKLKDLARRFDNRLNVLNVCLDYDYRNYEIIVKRDSLPGHNVCDCQAWESPLVRQLGVTSVPGNIIVAPDGKILDRDVPANDLRARLSKLIDNK